MSVLAAAIPLLGNVIDKIFPNAVDREKAKLALLEAQQKGELAALDADLRVMLGQMEVNKVEAGTDAFRGGWRPATGWTCVIGLGYTYLFQPIAAWFSLNHGWQVPPAVDVFDLLILLGGLLGLGGMRTFERIKGHA